MRLRYFACAALLLGACGSESERSTATTERSTTKPELLEGWTATKVIDGDTLEVFNPTDGKQTVRLIGIDAPEMGVCGSSQAKSRLAELTDELLFMYPGASDDKDRYGRLLRYVEGGSSEKDVGLELIESGLAIARYDSRDGYGRHTREDEYVAADRSSPNFECTTTTTTVITTPTTSPPATPAPTQPPATEPAPSGNCDPNYQPCVPISSSDLDCGDIGFSVTVVGSDIHGFDANGDGTGCESYG